MGANWLFQKDSRSVEDLEISSSPNFTTNKETNYVYFIKDDGLSLFFAKTFSNQVPSINSGCHFFKNSGFDHIEFQACNSNKIQCPSDDGVAVVHYNLFDFTRKIEFSYNNDNSLTMSSQFTTSLGEFKKCNTDDNLYGIISNSDKQLLVKLTLNNSGSYSFDDIQLQMLKVNSINYPLDFKKVGFLFGDSESENPGYLISEIDRLSQHEPISFSLYEFTQEYSANVAFNCPENGNGLVENIQEGDESTDVKIIKDASNNFLVKSSNRFSVFTATKIREKCTEAGRSNQDCFRLKLNSEDGDKVYIDRPKFIRDSDSSDTDIKFGPMFPDDGPDYKLVANELKDTCSTTTLFKRIKYTVRYQLEEEYLPTIKIDNKKYYEIVFFQIKSYSKFHRA